MSLDEWLCVLDFVKLNQIDKKYKLIIKIQQISFLNWNIFQYLKKPIAKSFIYNYSNQVNA